MYSKQETKYLNLLFSSILFLVVILYGKSLLHNSYLDTKYLPNLEFIEKKSNIEKSIDSTTSEINDINNKIKHYLIMDKDLSEKTEHLNQLGIHKNALELDLKILNPPKLVRYFELAFFNLNLLAYFLIIFSIIAAEASRQAREEKDKKNE